MADKPASDAKPAESQMMAVVEPPEAPVASEDATDSNKVEPAARQKRRVALFLTYVGSEYQARLLIPL